jgi:hypothetical protein
MRTLTIEETACVAGGTGVCTPQNSGNDLGGIKDSGSLGDDLINIYEGLVQATSHVIERVAKAIG